MTKLIERITPELAALFTTETVDKQDGHDVYEIVPDGEAILLRGSSQSALAAAYCRYLRECRDMDVSPCGNMQVYASENVRPLQNTIRQVILQDKRMSMTYETYANDAFAWDAERWMRELDYLALQGVNLLPMLVGQEAVWYYAALELGIRREDAMEYLSNPCYYPLQLAGKLDTIFPMTDTNYLKSRIELGRQILERMAELGITPVLPTFSGHIPKYIKGYHKNSALFFTTPYSEFPFTYRLMPHDPLFRRIGEAMNKKQEEFFGTADYYLADPFLGVDPRGVHDGALFQKYGQAIAALHPGKVWVSTACAHTAALTQTLEKEQVLILDTDGTFAAETNGFGGKPFITGLRLNHGGHTVLTGNYEALCRDPYAKLQKDYPNVCGLGVFADYTAANPLFISRAYTLLTQNEGGSAAEIFTENALRRWGSREECLQKAAGLLLETCYNTESPALPVGSVIAARPSTEITHTAPGDTLALHYDNKKLCAALEQMLASEGDYTEGYAFDVCDVTRQMLSNYARRLYTGVMEGYGKRDGRLFETATNAFLRVLTDMDRLLHTQPELCLYEHLTAARSGAEGKTDGQNFEIAFLANITLFGPMREPELYDLHWREWADLVCSYYGERWHEFFELLAGSFGKRRDISTVSRKLIDGRNPIRGTDFGKKLDKSERHWITTCAPTARSDEDTLTVAAELLQKYKPMIERDYIQ